jgi:hypothetical protein
VLNLSQANIDRHGDGEAGGENEHAVETAMDDAQDPVFSQFDQKVM